MCPRGAVVCFIARTQVACSCQALKNRSVLGLISSNRTSFPALLMRRNRNEPRRPDHTSTLPTAASCRQLDETDDADKIDDHDDDVTSETPTTV